MSNLLISKLQLNVLIGVHPEERLASQPIELDIKLTADIQKSCETDDIADAIDYDALIKHVQQWVSDKHFHLIEALANYLAESILQYFPVQAVKIKLRKFPAGLPVGYTGVTICKKRKAEIKCREFPHPNPLLDFTGSRGQTTHGMT